MSDDFNRLISLPPPRRSRPPAKPLTTRIPFPITHSSARHPDAVKAQGYIDDYQGVRISSTGKRFMIRNCVVWEVYDAAGVRRGQAATFDEIEPL